MVPLKESLKLFKCLASSCTHMVFRLLDLLGSKINKPSEILIKISNAAKYIESDTQNIEVPRIDDPII